MNHKLAWLGGALTVQLLVSAGLLINDLDGAAQQAPMPLLGFAPTPYDSGESQREQGMSRAGNARLQAVSIQLAWNWVRWQPESALTQWYQTNFGKGKRARRIGIVALARKLVVALWRYVTAGIVPTGAIVKVA